MSVVLKTPTDARICSEWTIQNFGFIKLMSFLWQVFPFIFIKIFKLQSEFKSIAMKFLTNYKLFLSSLIFCTSTAYAQNFAPQNVTVGSVSTSLNVNAINQFDTNINSGGSFSWQDANIHFNNRYQLDANSSIGLNLRDGYQNWSWRTVTG